GERRARRLDRIRDAPPEPSPARRRPEAGFGRRIANELMPKKSGRALDSRQLSLFDESRGDEVEVVPAGAPLRRMLLDGHPVAWELRRARRRTIGFMIDHRGLRVSAPRWVTLPEIERALV